MAKAGAKATFIVNWEVQGFRGKVHAIGAFIEAEAEEVAELVEHGAISLWDKVKGVRVGATVSAAVEGASDAPAPDAPTPDAPAPDAPVAEKEVAE